ncbi:hypothetical protein GINT2_001758 [Glugoides intestinalis]
MAMSKFTKVLTFMSLISTIKAGMKVTDVEGISKSNPTIKYITKETYVNLKTAFNAIIRQDAFKSISLFLDDNQLISSFKSLIKIRAHYPDEIKRIDILFLQSITFNDLIDIFAIYSKSSDKLADKENELLKVLIRVKDVISTNIQKEDIQFFNIYQNAIKNFITAFKSKHSTLIPSILCDEDLNKIRITLGQILLEMTNSGLSILPVILPSYILFFNKDDANLISKFIEDIIKQRRIFSNFPVSSRCTMHFRSVQKNIFTCFLNLLNAMHEKVDSKIDSAVDNMINSIQYLFMIDLIDL